jgi:hypothetical protein
MRNYSYQYITAFATMNLSVFYQKISSAKIHIDCRLVSSAFARAEEDKFIRNLDNDQTCHSELHFNASESIAKKYWLSGN